MSRVDTGVQVGGGWLAVASLLLAGVLAFHGPLAGDLDAQMRVIAAASTRWAVVHWIAAASLSLFAVAGLVVLTTGSRLTESAWTLSAWAVLTVGALWTTTTAVAEVTVIAGAAASGDASTFAAWWAFAEGKAAGFTFLALAVAVIAANEARSARRAMPVWASSIGAVAGVASFVGWAVGIWLGIRWGNLLWVGSSFVMCLWTFWFGVALMQRRGPTPPASSLVLLLAVLTFGACAPADRPGADPGTRPYDLLVTGGTVVDGTGEPRFRADVAVRGDRIVRVARDARIPADSAAEVLDAGGRIVAPGFFDNHAHIQLSIDDRPLLENFIRQGITTMLASEHSQDQPYPLGAYMDSIRMAPNVGFFAGHSWIRRRVIGMADRAPTAGELERMKALVEEAMEDGALGLSTGLQYTPAFYAETGEVIELAKVASRHGGIYSSHMRNEARGLLESVRELIRIADEADIPAQIQHHKAFGPGQWGWSERSLSLVDSAREAGLDVKHDQYPYTAASTGSSVLFPEWALAGGRDSLAARLEDPELRQRMRREMRDVWADVWTGDDLCRIQFRTVPALPAYDGRRLCDLAGDRGMPNSIDAGIDLVMELAPRGGFSAIYHAMSDQDVRRIMRHPWGMFETDGDPLGYGQGFPHPRSYGAFPRILGHYVRDESVLSLEEAVRKLTSLPADHVGQTERGRVAEGTYADLTVFDPETVSDRATFTDPHQYSVGIVHVVVNGVPVIEDASVTGEKPGRVIRGPARRPDR